ncbi:hypothetical protein HK100_006778 [Physocladia obscura]|uniref:Uncharacterized protein n=1 Tax=Physocladia obscura TaxID=109957 RepID=A0AAD5T521_9FUNG|nr:hypothetical protein HK100_006778 [Physocladia obscura]
MDTSVFADIAGSVNILSRVRGRVFRFFRWRRHIPEYVSWDEARQRGFDSSTFAINEDDPRRGFARDAAEEVQRLMDSHGVDFDQARVLLVQRQMRDNGIDPETGLPLDPRAVFPTVNTDTAAPPAVSS